MSYTERGAFAPTVTVSMDPDRSGNYVCDGIADDVQIQLAIDYAGALEGSVHIKSAVYDITAPLDLTGISAITIKGDTRARNIDHAAGAQVEEGTHLKLAAGVDDHLLQKIEGAPAKLSGITIRDLVLNGNAANQTPAAAGDVIYIEDAMYVIIERCLIMRAVRHGIHLINASENNSILNNKIVQYPDGIHCIFINNAVGATKIFGNTILGASANTACAIRINNAGVETIIAHNQISDSYYGIQMVDTARCIITSNHIVSITDRAIFLSNECSHHEISHNIIDTVTGAGIGIYISDYGTACEFNEVVDNQVLNCDTDGIQLRTLSNRNIVSRNVLSTNGAYGINIFAATVTGTIVKNNVFDNNATAAINDAGTDTAVHEELVYVTDSDGNVGDHPVLVLPDTVDTTFRFQVHIPLEFQETVTAQAIVLQTATGGPPDMQWSTTTDWGKLCAGENYNAGSDAETDQTTAVAQNELVCVDVSLSLTGIAAGDLVGFTFIRRATQGGDTINADAYYLGFRLRYV